MGTKIRPTAWGLRWAGLAAIVLATAPAAAQSNKILQIEEHWELQTGEPDPDRSAPQVTMVMSPHDSLDGLFFLFTLNHQSIPDYEPGGMQVQLWDGDAAYEASGADVLPLNQSNEVVRWTQRLKLEEGDVTFEIADGASDSWGAFGGSESLRITSESPLESLNNYRPAVSLTESQVGYGGNRVQSLVLKKLVWWTEDGESHELVAPIDIDADLDP
jgi:hypothetical protein